LEQIILGIDPGTNIMGYSVISIDNNNVKLLVLDVLRLEKLPNQAVKLKKIFDTTLRIIDEYQPDHLSIEAQFFGKNVQSMLKLGRAQGVAIAAALYRSVPICEYSPLKIKQSITGSGKSSKEQVAAMLERLIKIDINYTFLDATDALAVAYCHYLQNKTIKTDSKYGDWASYIAKNPDKVKKNIITK